MARCAGLLIALILCAPVLPGQDLSGIWAPRPGTQAGGMDGGLAVLSFGKDMPAMTPSAQAKYDAIRKGTHGPAERPRDEVDPHIHCLPYGMPRALAVNQPFEIVQAPGRVFMLFEADDMVRRICTDGRRLPKDAEPAYMGHSIGKWEGSTLVVETAGLNDLTWMDGLGHPHSDALHITERIRRIDPHTLQIDFTFDDPKTWVKPWSAAKFYELKPDWEISEQLACEDHLRAYHIPKLLHGEPE